MTPATRHEATAGYDRGVLLKVQRPLSGDLSNLLAYDEERKHTTFIPAACLLGQNLLKALDGAVAGYFPAEVGELQGEGEEATFIPHPEGSIIWIDASRTVAPATLW